MNVPKSMFPAAVVQESLYRQASVYLCLFVMVAALGAPVSWDWLWLAPVVFVNYLFIVACSLLGAYLVCLVRDIAKVIPLAMMFMLFTSGIFWDVHSIGSPDKTELILTINPLAFLLDANRQVLLHHSVPDFSHLFFIGTGSGVLIFSMLGLMRRNSQALALRVLTS